MQPDYTLAVQENPDNPAQLFMSLIITVGTARIETYLCGAHNYQDVASKLHKGIMEAGREMAKAQAGKLILAKEGDLNVRRTDR